MYSASVAAGCVWFSYAVFYRFYIVFKSVLLLKLALGFIISQAAYILNYLVAIRKFATFAVQFSTRIAVNVYSCVLYGVL